MADKNTIVRVKDGQLRGVVENNVYGGTYLAFMGIPFAKPPVGQLRFKDPEPVDPWTGVRDASKFGSKCAQIEEVTRLVSGSDDCLYLNVYTPSVNIPTKRAVMVWIHGGGFISGSGDNAIYGPDFLIRKEVVLVTINYRLGVIGFLNLEDEIAPGNQGLKDQVMALKWVQENIASFGGDPNNVTIFGESAGGAAVHYLTVSPLAQGLFHKAISQSGVMTNPWAHVTTDPRKRALQLAAKLGEHSTDIKTVLEFLRGVDAQKLAATEAQLIKPQDRITTIGLFGPGIDDKSPNPFLPQHPSQMMKAGVQVPFIIGFTDNEGSLFVCRPSATKNEKRLLDINKDFSAVVPSELKPRLAEKGLTAGDLKQLYFGDELVSSKTLQQLSDYVGDVMIKQSVYDTVDVQMEKSTQPTYFYLFSFDPPDSLSKSLLNITLPGAAHADDLMYLFYPRLMKNLGINPPQKGSDQYRVMEYFTQMWSDFAKTGNPTPSKTALIKTTWKPLEKSDSYNYLNININLKMEACKRGEQKQNWSRIKNKL